jgi:hypothetical protein
MAGNRGHHIGRLLIAWGLSLDTMSPDSTKYRIFAQDRAGNPKILFSCESTENPISVITDHYGKILQQLEAGQFSLNGLLYTEVSRALCTATTYPPA